MQCGTEADLASSKLPKARCCAKCRNCLHLFELSAQGSSLAALYALGHLSVPTGRRTVKVEPFRGSLATVTSPPIMRASLRVMVRPNPVPPKRCAVEASAWLNSSNTFVCCSGVMPMPLSATAISIQLRPSTSLRALSVTSPSLVNLQALLRRLRRMARFGELTVLVLDFVEQPHVFDRNHRLVGEGRD